MPDTLGRPSDFQFQGSQFQGSQFPFQSFHPTWVNSISTASCCSPLPSEYSRSPDFTFACVAKQEGSPQVDLKDCVSVLSFRTHSQSLLQIGQAGGRYASVNPFCG